MISEAGQLQPDSAAIGIVQDATSDGGWRVQMPGRYQSITCRSLTGGHRAGDPVIVLLEPHESIPVILGPSPWRVVSEIAPAQIYWPGITRRLYITEVRHHIGTTWQDRRTTLQGVQYVSP